MRLRRWVRPGCSQGVLTGQAFTLISPLSLSTSSHSFFMEAFHSLSPQCGSGISPFHLPQNYLPHETRNH